MIMRLTTPLGFCICMSLIFLYTDFLKARLVCDYGWELGGLSLWPLMHHSFWLCVVYNMGLSLD